MRTRVHICLTVSFVAVVLLIWGALFNGQQVYPGDPNDMTASRASEFCLNQAVAAGRLFRDVSGLLRIKSSAACPA